MRLSFAFFKLRFAGTWAVADVDQVHENSTEILPLAEDDYVIVAGGPEFHVGPGGG